MYKIMTGAAVAVVLTVGAASAATLTGTFSVTAVNVTNLNGTESQATLANFNAALGNTLGGGDSVSVSDTFSYTGAIDFGTFDGSDATTITDWLLTGIANGGGGSVSGLSGTLGGLQQSKPDISNSSASATTTFYLFEADFAVAPGDFTVVHDDGFAIFEDGNLLDGVLGPTSQQTNSANGFGGGDLSFLYVATNGDPSVLNIDVAPVPLPAPLALLLAGIAGLVGMKRMRSGRAAA